MSTAPACTSDSAAATCSMRPPKRESPLPSSRSTRMRSCRWAISASPTSTGRYSDYQTFGIDLGVRKYAQLRPGLKAYGEGSLGIGFVDKIDVQLVAPGANLTLAANDYYDQTTAFTLGAAAGILAQANNRVRDLRADGSALRQRAV